MSLVEYKYVSTSRLTRGGLEIPAARIGQLPKTAIDKAVKSKIIKIEKPKTTE